MAKVKVKQCYCGKHFHKFDGVWKAPNKMQTESLKMFVEKGTAEIERVQCDECKKAGCQ